MPLTLYPGKFSSRKLCCSWIPGKYSFRNNKGTFTLYNEVCRENGVPFEKHGVRGVCYAMLLRQTLVLTGKLHTIFIIYV